MGTHVSGAPGRKEIKTFALLDQMITTLGSTKTTMFPFLEATDDLVRSYKEQYHTLVPTSSGPGFDPYMHSGGVNSYLFNPDNAMYLLGEDSTDFDMGDGATDEVFSVGLWILPFDVTSVELMAKYDTNSQRTWRFGIDGSNKLFFDQYDESADATEIFTSTTSVTTNQWTFVVWTYDGGETAPVIAVYQDTTVDVTVDTTESGTYTAMEDNTAALTIGASLATGVPTNPFNGRIALPFICGRQLTSAQVTTLFGIGQTLLGL